VLRRNLPVVACLVLLMCTGCLGNINNKVINIKYREKNAVEVIRIDSENGDVELIGWSKDSIEINTRKVLYSGFNTDQNLMDTVFDKTENELNIRTKIPARVDGKIDLKVYVPYVLTKMYVNTRKGDITIEKALGDLEVTNSNGDCNISFQGNILRINSYRSRVNLDIKSYNSSDIVINNEEGDTKIEIETIGRDSYMDVKSLNGDVVIAISEEIDHELVATSNGRRITARYKLDNMSQIDGAYTSLSGSRGKTPGNFTLDITNENGKINLSLLGKRLLRGTLGSD
jgi:hypothetical protein